MTKLEMIKQLAKLYAQKEKLTKKINELTIEAIELTQKYNQTLRDEEL